MSGVKIVLVNLDLPSNFHSNDWIDSWKEMILGRRTCDSSDRSLEQDLMSISVGAMRACHSLQSVVY